MGANILSALTHQIIQQIVFSIRKRNNKKPHRVVSSRSVWVKSVWVASHRHSLEHPKQSPLLLQNRNLSPPQSESSPPTRKITCKSCQTPRLRGVPGLLVEDLSRPAAPGCGHGVLSTVGSYNGFDHCRDRMRKELYRRRRILWSSYRLFCCFGHWNPS